MKIYTKVVIDMATMQTEHEESFEYNGPLALCDFGGSSSSPSGGSDVDKDYNKRIATIAEAQQGMAEEMMGYYREHGLPLDVSMAEAGLELLPHQTALEKGQLQADIGLLPHRTGLTSDTLQAQRRLLPQQEQVSSKFLTEAQEGVDKGVWADRAGAGVQKAADNLRGQTERHYRGLGLDPSSGNFQRTLGQGSVDMARAIGGARSDAKQAAEQEDFRRLQIGSGLGLGG